MDMAYFAKHVRKSGNNTTPSHKNVKSNVVFFRRILWTRILIINGNFPSASLRAGPSTNPRKPISVHTQNYSSLIIAPHKSQMAER